MVIPAQIRAQAGLLPGTELEVVLEAGSIRLIRDVPGPKLVRVGKRLVVRPTVPRKDLPKVDVAKLIDQERDRWPW